MYVHGVQLGLAAKMFSPTLPILDIDILEIDKSVCFTRLW